jgi:hypothetical protein
MDCENDEEALRRAREAMKDGYARLDVFRDGKQLHDPNDPGRA